MNTLAVVLEEPERLVVRQLELSPPGDDDVVVDIEWSGISTGTERLLWSGRMPAFPGMGYPLVPGYESVGRVASAARRAAVRRVGERVFVPGARCFGDVRGLFGGAARRVVVPGAARGADRRRAGRARRSCSRWPRRRTTRCRPTRRPFPISSSVTACSAGCSRASPSLRGAPRPPVWERNPPRARAPTATAWSIPADDARRDYRAIYDVSGDAALLDTLIARLAPGGEIVLAGFYAEPLSFAFPPAFMREARIRVAAQWQPRDLVAVRRAGRVGSAVARRAHHAPRSRRRRRAARTAPRSAIPSCLKMVLDWRACS